MTNKIQTLVGDTQLTDLNTAELQPLTGLDPKQSDKRVAIKISIFSIQERMWDMQ